MSQHDPPFAGEELKSDNFSFRGGGGGILGKSNPKSLKSDNFSFLGGGGYSEENSLKEVF